MIWSNVSLYVLINCFSVPGKSFSNFFQVVPIMSDFLQVFLYHGLSGKKL